MFGSWFFLSHCRTKTHFTPQPPLPAAPLRRLLGFLGHTKFFPKRHRLFIYLRHTSPNLSGPVVLFLTISVVSRRIGDLLGLGAPLVPPRVSFPVSK